MNYQPQPKPENCEFNVGMGKTPNRSVRIPDKLWKQVQAKAKREHTTVSAIIIRLLVQWLE
jgi:hypothetical protein